jgi:hypothetical protein
MQEVLVNVPGFSHIQPLSKIHVNNYHSGLIHEFVKHVDVPCSICTMILLKEAECILFWSDMPGITQFKVTHLCIILINHAGNGTRSEELNST